MPGRPEPAAPSSADPGSTSRLRSRSRFGVRPGLRVGLRPGLRFGARRALVAFAAFVVGLVALGLILDRLFPPPLEALHRPASVRVLDRGGEPLRFFLARDDRWRFPVGLDEVPEGFVEALLASEDRRFYRHGGVDLRAAARAARDNLGAGRVVSGASTIPMQLARLARPARRTFGAKVVEAFRALQISRRLSKGEVLELYLNRLPYGGNLEGVGAASYFYFGKRPAQLSVGETALLITLPRSPTAYDPTRNPEAARAARDRVLGQLEASGVVSPEEAAAARRQDVPRRRRPAPARAPHLSRWAAAGGAPEGGVLSAPAAGGVLRLTVDPRAQAAAEAAVASRAAELRRDGLGNAAALVVDLETREVRAWVGSAGFGEAAYDGQVDGVVARRSPGSTLKPFLYAQAFDRGLAVPGSFLLDVPTDYAGYVAENYDGTYRGQVTARDALTASLNAPAVRLLAEVGLEEFHQLLRRGGADSLDQPPGHYGLPLILGAGEVTLRELVGLYADLADGGRHRPLEVLLPPAAKDGGEGETGRPAAGELFSAGAARMVAETLVEVARPDLPEAWDVARSAPTVAWKTGTSFGHRDAWAVGFSGRHAVGVWVGWFSGRPAEGISGSTHAAPLLFDLFRALGDDTRPALLAAGGPARGEIGRLRVCAASRHLPTDHCPDRVEVDYLPGTTRLPRCTAHRRVFLDRETGEILAGACLSERPFEAAVLEAAPPELLAWRRARGEAVEPLPALSAACGGAPAAAPPRIVSPDGATPFRLRPEAPLADQRIPLLARAGTYSRRFFWYQGGELVGSGTPGERLFLTPRPGRHELVLVDDTGRVDRVEYEVIGW